MMETMASELLKKEKEYYELNEKLEMRTKELLQEVDNVMKIQSTILVDQPKFNPRYYEIDDETRVKPEKVNVLHKSKSAPINGKRTDVHLTAKECRDLNVPRDVNAMGAKGLVQFLKAKAINAQGEHNKIATAYKAKCEECKRIQKENQKMTEEKDKWIQGAHLAKQQSMKYQDQMLLSQSKIQVKDTEMQSLRKEIEELQRELKNVKTNSSNLEVRLARAAEDAEKSKTALKAAQQEGKDLQDNHKKQINELLAVIKRNERHKVDLLDGFRKQLLLIDNLKKQKAYIECYKVTEKVEEDFMKMLDWNVADS